MSAMFVSSLLARWKEEIAALREILARRYRDSTSEGAGVPLPPAPVVTSTAESGAAPPAVPPAVGSAAAVNSRGNDRTRAPLTPAPFVDLSTAGMSLWSVEKRIPSNAHLFDRAFHIFRSITIYTVVPRGTGSCAPHQQT